MSGSDRRSSRRLRGTTASSSAIPATESSTTPRRRRPTGPPDRATIIASIDGGARGNPGQAGFGVYVEDEAGTEIASLYGYLGERTNNVAEYAGLLAALRFAFERGIERIAIRSDSQLLVRQINGEYRVKNPTLQRLHATAKRLMQRIGSVTIRHVRREENRDADRLANEAMDTRAEQPEGITRGLLE